MPTVEFENVAPPRAGTDLAERKATPSSAAILPSISIVLPCFNEAENVERSIAEATDAGRRFAEDFEVIVVDDGSSDDTASIARRVATTNPAVRLVRHETNQGYGAAVRSGFKHARSSYVFLTDGDLQFDLNQIELLLPHVADSDIVVGNRVNRQDNFVRRANAKAWNILIHRLLRIPVKDIDCAFKLIDRNLVDRLELVSDGAMISTELLARSLKLGARISEVDVRHRPRVAGEPTGNNPRVVIRAFRELIALRSVLAKESSS